MNFQENPNPKWNHDFSANIDPPMDFELSDYLSFDDGAAAVDQDSTPSQSMLWSDIHHQTFVAGGSSTGATSRDHTNIQETEAEPTWGKCKNIGMRKNKMDQMVGHEVAFKTKTELDVMDDGFKWRKYGQKSVGNSPYPRHYYRCSSRNSRGCKVTKTVERDTEDSSYVITTYRGVHNHERGRV